MYSIPEDYEAAFDESFEEDYAEARSRPGARPMPRVPTSRGSSYRPPVPAAVAGSAVTQTQLKEVVDRFNAALATNGKAISQVDGRTRTLATDQQRLDSGLRREVIDRRKEITAVRRDLQSTREVSAMLPLLNMLAPGNMLVSLAPMLMLGNDVSGSTDAGAASSGGLLGGLGSGLGGNSMGLITLVALSGALNRPTP
jgi:hypothetical protein